MRNHIEDDNQEALIRWCTLNQVKHPALRMIFAIPNGGKRNIREAARLKRQGVKAGIPDLCLPVSTFTLISRKYKPTKLFGSLYIEMKVKPNRPTKDQKEKHEKLQQFGNKVIVAYSWTEAVNAICEYLGIPERV